MEVLMKWGMVIAYLGVIVGLAAQFHVLPPQSRRRYKKMVHGFSGVDRCGYLASDVQHLILTNRIEQRPNIKRAVVRVRA